MKTFFKTISTPFVGAIYCINIKSPVYKSVTFDDIMTKKRFHAAKITDELLLLLGFELDEIELTTGEVLRGFRFTHESNSFLLMKLGRVYTVERFRVLAIPQRKGRRLFNKQVITFVHDLQMLVNAFCEGEILVATNATLGRLNGE